MSYFFDDEPSGSALGRALVDPFAEFWSNGEGPSHPAIDRKIAAAGLPIPDGSKQNKIIKSFLAANEAQAYGLMKGLLDVLRKHENSYWSSKTDKDPAAKEELRQAIQGAGYLLDEDFKLIEGGRKPVVKKLPPSVKERLEGVSAAAVISDREKVSIHQAEANTAPPKEIFLVHGHDEAIRREVSELVADSFRVKPIVLSKELSGGMTLIEKFEAYSSDAACAIIIMTPDDQARTKSAPKAVEERARQNVVFELGYFYGKLRRKNVIVLNFGVEIPGDIKGLVDVRGPDWKLELLKELAGLGYKSKF